ncbi:hypothetical protein ABIB85_004840 [Bradyrhizobium sp. JR1.5]
MSRSVGVATRRCKRRASVDDLGCVWSVATCSSVRRCGSSACPFLGRAAAQRSDAPAPRDRHREGAARRRSKRDDIVALRCLAIPAWASEAIVVNEAGRGLTRGTAAPGVGRMAGGRRRYETARFSRICSTWPEIRALNGGYAPGVSRCPAPAVAGPFSAAVGEPQNEALGSREGEPTHAIVEVHPLRAEAVVVS